MAGVAAEEAIKGFVGYVRENPGLLYRHIFSEGLGEDRRYVVKNLGGDTVLVMPLDEVMVRTGDSPEWTFDQYVFDRLDALVCKNCTDVLYDSEQSLCSPCEGHVVMDLLDLERELV